jgi:hypothetical protein
MECASSFIKFPELDYHTKISNCTSIYTKLLLKVIPLGSDRLLPCSYNFLEAFLDSILQYVTFAVASLALVNCPFRKVFGCENRKMLGGDKYKE